MLPSVRALRPTFWGASLLVIDDVFWVKFQKVAGALHLSESRIAPDYLLFGSSWQFWFAAAVLLLAVASPSYTFL